MGIREENLVKIYVNGNLEGFDIGSNSPINYGSTPSASIGQKDGLSPAWYNGSIDDVRIYKKALSTQDINTLLLLTSTNNIEKIENSIQIFPNPATDNLNITSNNNSKINLIEIYSINGQKVKSFSDNQINHFLRFNISDLSVGSYFIKIFNNNELVQVTKFIKQKN